MLSSAGAARAGAGAGGLVGPYRRPPRASAGFLDPVRRGGLAASKGGGCFHLFPGADLGGETSSWRAGLIWAPGGVLTGGAAMVFVEKPNAARIERAVRIDRKMMFLDFISLPRIIN